METWMGGGGGGALSLEIIHYWGRGVDFFFWNDQIITFYHKNT